MKPIPILLSQFWRDISLVAKGIVVILLPLMLLMASIGFLYKSEQQLSSLENELKAALQNQRDIQTVHTQLLEATTAVRDYLLTGDKAFLKQFKTVEQQLPSLMQKLESALENQGKQARLETIEPLVIDNLKQLSVLAQYDADEASDDLIQQFKQQVASLDTLRNAIEALMNEEAVLVNQDQKIIALERERNFNITLFAVIAGIIGSFFAVWIFSSTIVKRVKELRDSASHLAKAEPLNLPSSGRDELGQLNDELDQASELLAENIYQAQQAKQAAEHANQSKSMFLSRTSHELRTPLNAILGFAQLLQSDLKEGKSFEQVALIKSAGEHLLKLIDEVLHIAKIETGEQTVELQPISINDLLAEAIHYIAPLGKIRDMDIEHHIDPNLTGHADYQKLLQVVLNILSNALKYGPVNSTVSVRAYERAQFIVIEILDEGSGIPTELRDRLFTPFDRLGAEQSKIEGTGLGLALSKKIMLAMDGDIEVGEQQSLFSIILKSAESAPEQSAAQVKQQQNHNNSDTEQKQHQVIYVEDNASNKALVEAILARQANITLVTASNLHEGRNFMHDMQASLIIIDLNLPDGSGETLVEEIQAARYGSPIPIIVLSADAVPESIQRLKALGVKYYLTKPFNIAEFTHAVNTLIKE